MVLCRRHLNIEPFFLCVLAAWHFNLRSAAPQNRRLAWARPIKIFWFGFVFVLPNCKQSRLFCQIFGQRQAGLLSHLPAKEGGPAQNEAAQANGLT